ERIDGAAIAYRDERADRPEGHDRVLVGEPVQKLRHDGGVPPIGESADGIVPQPRVLRGEVLHELAVGLVARLYLPDETPARIVKGSPEGRPERRQARLRIGGGLRLRRDPAGPLRKHLLDLPRTGG